MPILPKTKLWLPVLTGVSFLKTVKVLEVSVLSKTKTSKSPSLSTSASRRVGLLALYSLLECTTCDWSASKPPLPSPIYHCIFP